MPAFKNERLTENWVRDELRRLGYYKKNGSKVRIEEQRSEIEAVRRLMKSASKSGQGGGGAPEFIVSCQNDPDFLLIIECKADASNHISNTCKSLLAGGVVEEDDNQQAKRTQRYAVDGALHYAKFLAKEFYVVAVAVSGSDDAAIISTYLHAKGGTEPKPLQTKNGAEVTQFIPWSDYVEHATFDPAVQSSRADELIAFSRDMHIFMRDHAKLTESEKPLLVSGTLIALRNKAFAKAYDEYDPEELQNEWFSVISKEVHKASIPQAKRTRWFSLIRRWRPTRNSGKQQRPTQGECCMN